MSPQPPHKNLLPPYDEEGGPSTICSQSENAKASTPALNTVPPLQSLPPSVEDLLLSDEPLLNLPNDFASEFTLPPLTFTDLSNDLDGYSYSSLSPPFQPCVPMNDAADFNDFSMLFLNDSAMSGPVYGTDERNNTSSDESSDDTVSPSHPTGFSTDDISTTSYSQTYFSVPAVDTVESDDNAEASSSGAGDSQYEPRSDVGPSNPPPPTPRSSRGRKVPWSEGNVSPDTNRTIQCNVCGRWFHRGEHVKRHIATLHSTAKPYACLFPTCNKVFSRRDNCKYHYNAHFKPAKEKKRVNKEPKKQDAAA
ncbi:hypothetical protein EV401DRAFT_2068774 [Pisolithus croceorrhizus]|nr:hypothetical protein EV401DRAFT_2068774 [Pisolithus croceorrhizus]